MKPYYEHAGITIYHGNALDILRELPGESINCCITSPPYWGLRDYGTGEWTGGLPDCDHTYNHGTQGATGQRADRTFTAQAVYKDECRRCGAKRIDKQIGLEATPQQFVAKMVEVFEEVRRVLRSDGTLWLNLGDSYASQGGAHGGRDDNQSGVGAKRTHISGGGDKHARTPCYGLKPKDLVGIPWRVAFALQDAGWWLRSDIIWAKPAPMPESVTDRPTRSHEYIFLLAKSEKYYCDMESIKEPSVADHGSGNGFKRDSRLSFSDQNGVRGSDVPWKPTVKARSPAGWKTGKGSHGTIHPEGREQEISYGQVDAALRNKRDVWTVNTDPFPEAHFATFPPALILPCVLAGCPAGGTILDPFMGAATTGLVAKANGRRAIGIELSADYCEIAAQRLSQEVLQF